MLAQENLNRFENAKRVLRSIENPDLRYGDTGWTIRQILGHMIDSCSMNHQRIGRRKQDDEISFPGYEQDNFVANMNYAEMEFQVLLNLWESYNTVLMKAFSSLSDADLDNSTFLLRDGTPKPYRWWIDFYFEHMEKHTKQVIRILEASGLGPAIV